jgi:hypothetical protein
LFATQPLLQPDPLSLGLGRVAALPNQILESFSGLPSRRHLHRIIPFQKYYYNIGLESLGYLNYPNGAKAGHFNFGSLLFFTSSMLVSIAVLL